MNNSGERGSSPKNWRVRDSKMADEKQIDLPNNFTVGSYIKCNYQGNQVEGELVAYQPQTKLFMIKAPSSNGKSSSNDVFIISADCLEKISIDDRGPPEVLKSIDFQKVIDFRKLDKRKTKETGMKRARIRALSADVAPEGRKLFLTINKTIDEVAWNGEKIVVLNEVTISPPYRTDDVKGDKEASVIHVRKIVDKHWKENGPKTD